MSNINLEDQYQCDIFAAIKIKMLIFSTFFFLIGNRKLKKFIILS